MSAKLFTQYSIVNGLLILSIAVSGCKSIAPSHEKMDKAIRDATSGRLDKEIPQAWTTHADAAVVENGWASTFNDETLVQLITEAQKNNRQVAAAAANVERARALSTQAGAKLLPQAGLGANVGGQGTGDGAKGDFGVNAQISWELDLWGRIRSERQAVEASAQAVEADFLFARHSIAAAVAKAYFTAIEAQIQTQVTQTAVSLLSKTLDLVTVRYQNGAASSQDVALSKSDLANARDKLSQAEGAYRGALRALEVLLGRYPSAELKVRPLLPSLPPPPPSGLPSDILERRPDIIAAERRVAAAFNAVAQAKAARLPSISLTSSGGTASSSLVELANPLNLFWSAGANLLAPILDGGQRKAQVKIESASQKEALALYAQAALTAFSEVENALDQGGVLASRATELDTAAEEAEKAYQIAELRYKEGETDLLDVLVMQQRLNQRQSLYTTVLRLQLEQRVNLYLALGGNWQNTSVQ